MPANTSPIYTLSPALGSGQLTPSVTANTKSDGAGTIGTDIIKVFTADATNGSYVSSLRFCPYATVAATATTSTTLRVFISTQTSGATTAADTWLFAEVSAAAQTADHSTNATFAIEIPINRILPPSYTILVTQHVVAAANTGWHATVFAGNY
jgi:hypothetical protein